VNGPTGTKKPAGVGGLVVWISANGKLCQIGIPEIAHDKATLEVLALLLREHGRKRDHDVAILAHRVLMAFTSPENS
jgi:hypothetical protein